MDRNFCPVRCDTSGHVALRKESVDRNVGASQGADFEHVALRKESVDRNVFLTLTVRNVPMSLSARRAWIEMMFWPFRPCWKLVALRKESVDRNGMEIDGVSYDVCRSPQGERG